MNLFNRKTLNRHIKPEPIPAGHAAILESWADLVQSGRVFTLKETALHGQFASKIIEGVLGYHGPTGGAEYTVSTEQAILRGSVDLALGRFGGKTPEILAPFELKGAGTRDLDAIMPGRNKSPVQQAWERDSILPFAFIAIAWASDEEIDAQLVACGLSHPARATTNIGTTTLAIFIPDLERKRSKSATRGFWPLSGGLCHPIASGSATS